MNLIEVMLSGALKNKNYAKIDSIIFICKIENIRKPEDISIYKRSISQIIEFYNQQFNPPVSREMVSYCNYSKTTDKELYNLNSLDIISGENIKDKIVEHAKLISEIKINIEYKVEYITNIFNYYSNIDPNFFSTENLNVLLNLQKELNRKRSFYRTKMLLSSCCLFSLILFLFGFIKLSLFIIFFFSAQAIMYSLKLWVEKKQNNNLLHESLLFFCIVLFSLLSLTTIYDNFSTNKKEYTAKVEAVNIVNENYKNVKLNGINYLTENDYCYGEEVTYKTGLNPFVVY